MDDAVVDEKLCGDLVTAAFTTTGQVCLAVKRVYAPEHMVDAIAAGIADVLEDYVIGPGMEPESTMGPLHTSAQRARVRELLADAKAQGATIRFCGDLAGNPDKGYFQLPAVVTGLSHNARLVAEEQFGPALPILPYANLDHAIEMVNDSPYGLASSIWTEDEDRRSCLRAESRPGRPTSMRTACSLLIHGPRLEVLSRAASDES